MGCIVAPIIANAAMAGLYAVGPPLYPTAVRTTGMGWAIGIGRFGAILAPLASGALLDRGWLPAQLYFFFSAPFLTAAIAILLIGPARASIQSNPGSLFRCRLRGLLRPTNGGS